MSDPEKEVIGRLLDEVVYERSFYEEIAETKEYDVIPIGINGESSLARKAMEAHCERDRVKILYRLSYGNYAVVFCRDGTGKIGIVPENNSDGWSC